LIRRCGLFKSFKETKVVLLPRFLNVCLPLSAACMPRHAFDAGFISFQSRHVGHVFTLRSFAQVLYTVVVAATVNMIKPFTGPPAVYHSPRNTMRAQHTSINTYSPVPYRQRPRAFACFHPLRCMPPIKNSCFSVVPKQRMQSGDSDFLRRCKEVCYGVA